ncbi:MAG: hypothetical protein RIS36_1986 [Pseudomonadota bacterium]|jgi:hypothetical protein
MSITLNPPYEMWGAILTSNLSVVKALHRALGEEFVASVRREVRDVAARYRAEMWELAVRLGISLPAEASRASHGDTAIVMAGHQPVIYHPGILEKITRLRAIASESAAYAVNVAIDTDEGDGGRLLWPLRDADDVVIKQRSIGTGEGLYREQRVVSREQSAPIFAEMREDLESSGCLRAVEGAARAEILYAALEGESIVIANAIVRKSLSDGGYDEVPLSLLLEAPAVREFIERIIRDSERFVSLYNETLETYRSEHKIKNPANPFPNMTVTDDEIEMPLWEIGRGSRKGVIVKRGKESLPSNLIAPRGSIVTLLLRGVCSDLFTHGIGGGKYDPFVNAFAEAYWGNPLPRFVVASATEYLFPERVRELLYAREVKARYKEMVSHTASFVGKGIFSHDDENILTPLLIRRRDLLPQMQGVKAKEERSVVAHELNQVNRAIKAAIDSSSIAPLLAQGGIDDAHLNRWAYREYPFFFWVFVKSSG